MFVLALQASLQINDGTTWSSADLQARMRAGTSLTASQTSGGREHDYNLSQGYAIAAPPSGQGDTVTVRISGISHGDVDLQRVRFTDIVYDAGAGILISARDATSGGLLMVDWSVIANVIPCPPTPPITA
jgi:hypothetical protein